VQIAKAHTCPLRRDSPFAIIKFHQEQVKLFAQSDSKQQSIPFIWRKSSYKPR